MDSSRRRNRSWGHAALSIAAILGGGVAVVAATIAVEGVIGGAFGDRQDNRDQGLDP